MTDELHNGSCCKRKGMVTPRLNPRRPTNPSRFSCAARQPHVYTKILRELLALAMPVRSKNSEQTHRTQANLAIRHRKATRGSAQLLSSAKLSVAEGART